MWFNVVIDVMKVVVSTEVKKYAENKVIAQLIKWYTKYKNVQQKLGHIKSIYNLVVNPNNWIKAITSVPKSEINNLLKEINAWQKFYEAPDFSDNERYSYEQVATEVGMPSSPETQEFRINKEIFNRKMEELKREMNGQGEWTQLSSSWIKAGMFKMIFKNKMLGSLSIQTKKNNRTYIYPLVPYDVWVLMKEANGMNGGGAGTIFWKYWLHDWMPSALRRKVQNDFHNNRIGREEYNIALDQIRRSSQGFVRSNTFRNTRDALNKEWYDKRGGKGFKSGRYDTYTHLYEKLSEEMYIKPATYGYTTIINSYKKVRNTDYINKKDQAKIIAEAKKEAKTQAYNTMYNRSKRAKRNTYDAFHPIRTANRKVRKTLVKKARKWGK